VGDLPAIERILAALPTRHRLDTAVAAAVAAAVSRCRCLLAARGMDTAARARHCCGQRRQRQQPAAPLLPADALLVRPWLASVPRRAGHLLADGPQADARVAPGA